MRRAAGLLALTLFVPAMAMAENPPEAVSTPPSAWLQAESFAGGSYKASDDANFNEFELGRAEVGAGFREVGFGGLVLNLEFVRSASPESLFGIDGNSLIARAKHVFGFADPELGPGRLRVAVGLIQDPWISTLEAGYRIRAMRPTASESTELFDTSDLGASLGYSLWDGFAEVNVAWTNGEGRNQTEQNTGKNATVVASLRPLRTKILSSDAVLGAHLVWREGSVGQGFAPNHRMGGALTWTHRSFEVGTEFIQAEGTSRRDIPSQVLSAWADGDIVNQWLGAFAAAEAHNLNTNLDDASKLTLSAGIYCDLMSRKESMSWRATTSQDAGLQRLRVALHGRTDTYESQAGALEGIPGLSDFYQLNLTVEAAGLLF